MLNNRVVESNDGDYLLPCVCRERERETLTYHRQQQKAAKRQMAALNFLHRDFFFDSPTAHIPNAIVAWIGGTRLSDSHLTSKHTMAKFFKAKCFRCRLLPQPRSNGRAIECSNVIRGSDLAVAASAIVRSQSRMES